MDNLLHTLGYAATALLVVAVVVAWLEHLQRTAPRRRALAERAAARARRDMLTAPATRSATRQNRPAHSRFGTLDAQLR